MYVNETMGKFEFVVGFEKTLAEVGFVNHSWKIKILIVIKFRHDFKLFANKSVFVWKRELFADPSFIPETSIFQWKIFK